MITVSITKQKWLLAGSASLAVGLVVATVVFTQERMWQAAAITLGAWLILVFIGVYFSYVNLSSAASRQPQLPQGYIMQGPLGSVQAIGSAEPLSSAQRQELFDRMRTDRALGLWERCIANAAASSSLPEPEKAVQYADTVSAAFEERLKRLHSD